MFEHDYLIANSQAIGGLVLFLLGVLLYWLRGMKSRGPFEQTWFLSVILLFIGVIMFGLGLHRHYEIRLAKQDHYASVNDMHQGVAAKCRDGIAWMIYRTGNKSQACDSLGN